MRRTFAFLIIIVTSLLVGCALPQHNNTLIFSVQRDVGVGVKTPVDGTAPSVYLGYKSSEIAWVPLWANKSSGIFKATTMPCNTSTGNVVECIKGPKFVGDGDTPGRNDAHDAYSTFASFGGDFGASISKDNGQNVSGRMASFFATGIAAQHLSRAPQMVGLPPQAAKESKSDEPKTPLTMISDFLKTTSSITQTVTVAATGDLPATSKPVGFDYTPACVMKMGMTAGLSAKSSDTLKKLTFANDKFEKFFSDLKADDELKKNRENLGMAARLLHEQLSKELQEQDSKSAAHAKVCG